MKACVLAKPSPVESNPLRLMDVPVPGLGAGQVLVRVHACGVCRTDLHVVEGELPPRKSPVVPGHQVVGTIEQNGPGASRFAAGTRVGIPWLHRTCGVCEYLPVGPREPLRARGVHRLDGGWRLRRVRRCSAGFCLRPARGLSRSACGAAAVRRASSASGRCGFRECSPAAAWRCTASEPRHTWPSRWRGTGTLRSTPSRATQRHQQLALRSRRRLGGRTRTTSRRRKWMPR